MGIQPASREVNRDEAGRFGGTDAPWTCEADLHCTLQSDANVLLTGPWDQALAVARAVHDRSAWRHGRFTAIDCTLPEGLVSRLAEAFTPGSSSGEPDRQSACDGTVVLLEVGHIRGELQVRLADLLASQRARRRPRLIASTSECLLQRVLDGTFSDQLFYRLNAIHLFLASGPDPESHGAGRPSRLPARREEQRPS